MLITLIAKSIDALSLWRHTWSKGIRLQKVCIFNPSLYNSQVKLILWRHGEVTFNSIEFNQCRKIEHIRCKRTSECTLQMYQMYTSYSMSDDDSVTVTVPFRPLCTIKKRKYFWKYYEFQYCLLKHNTTTFRKLIKL